MDRKVTGHSADYIKRQAKKLKKEKGIPLHDALDKAAQKAGFTNWEHFINTNPKNPTYIQYFMRQADNLFSDYKTRSPFVDEVASDLISEYSPKHFDMDGIVCAFAVDKDNFSLVKAQDIIAYLAGFELWADLLKAPKDDLKLAKLLFDNQDKILIEDWEMYIAGAERDNNLVFDINSRLEIFKTVILNVKGHENSFQDFRINQNLAPVTKSGKPRQAPKTKPGVQITSLPLGKADRAEFIETANSVFESVMERMEPQNPGLTRKLWDAGDYVDSLLTEDMLPISKDYALSLIDAFLVHHVLGLATEGDKQAK